MTQSPLVEVATSSSLVTVVIVAFRNRREELRRCIASVVASPMVHRVILVNNDPSDDVPRRIASEFTRSEALEMGRNAGFCAAVNRAARSTNTPYLMLLNPDAYVAPDFIDRLVDYLESHPEAASAGGRLMRLREGRETNEIDSLGIEVRSGRRPADIGHGTHYSGVGEGTREVFGITAAAAVYRVSAVGAVSPQGEILPGPFFTYLDDVDLAWRLRRAGYFAAVDEAAVAYHARLPGGEELLAGNWLRAAVSRARTEIQRPAYIRYLSW